MNKKLDGDKPTCADYRHVAVHGRLIGADLEGAPARFESEGLWSRTNPRRFLHPQGPALSVLDALGVPNAATLIDDLFAGLETSIKTR